MTAASPLLRQTAARSSCSGFWLAPARARTSDHVDKTDGSAVSPPTRRFPHLLPASNGCAKARQIFLEFLWRVPLSPPVPAIACPHRVGGSSPDIRSPLRAIAKLGPMPPSIAAIISGSRILQVVPIATAQPGRRGGCRRGARCKSATAPRHSEAATTFTRSLLGEFANWVFIQFSKTFDDT
jgi:hypothetical protein